MKIAVMGYSGSGKSTLARELGRRHGLPVMHMDAAHHLPGWKERDRAEEIDIVSAFLAQNGGWVIDGNYSRVCYRERLEAADRVILLLFGRFRCLVRVTKRYLRYRGSTRPDLAPGCPEKLDRQFVLWVLRTGRSRTARDRYRAVQAAYPEKTVVIHTQRQLDAFLREEVSFM